MQQLDSKPKAFLFDLNGTMINDMNFHADAWHFILTNDLGLDISYAEVKKQMYGKNDELLARLFGENHFDKAQLSEISMNKEKRYQSAYLPHLTLIPGLANFLESAKKSKILMAIGSAAIPFNIDFVLDGLNIRTYFNAIISANDVKVSKPNAETFINGALALGVEPKNCIVFEDVPKGVEAAQNAGMKCFVLTTTHETHEFNGFDNILGFIEDYNDPMLKQLC
jgi:beta-phosphoglucomutase